MNNIPPFLHTHVAEQCPRLREPGPEPREEVARYGHKCSGGALTPDSWRLVGPRLTPLSRKGPGETECDALRVHIHHGREGEGGVRLAGSPGQHRSAS